MAPTTTTLFSESSNLANGSAVVTSMLSSTPSVHATVSQHAQTTSPNQFIPVGVLTVLLILLFISHLMRYPRILYASRELLGNKSPPIYDNPCLNRQGHRNFHEKEQDTPAGFFSRPPFFGSKRLSSFDPHTEAIYSEPTVRLVRAYHDRSPEPRVYLPEEITLPSPSPTLVNSSRTDGSISNNDLRAVSPRVCLPSPLPETFEVHLTNQQAEVFYNSNDTSPLILPWRPLSHQYPPGLFISPLKRSFTGFYDVPAASDLLALPLMQDQPQASPMSVNPVIEQFEAGPQVSHYTCSQELSRPPLAHAHPTLVRQALSSWRRRPPLEPSYDTFQIDPDVTSVSTHRHRPSVPSRLRYFITRSVTTSFSGSQIHSTPASSSGKRSGKPLTSSIPSSNHDAIDLMTSRRAEEDSGACFTEDLFSRSTTLSGLAMTPEIQWQYSSFLNQSLAQATHQQHQPLNIHRQLSVPEHVWRDSLASSANAENDTSRETRDFHKRQSSTFISADIHEDTPDSLSLGLSLVPELRPAGVHAHGILAPSASSQNAKNTSILGTEFHTFEDIGLDTPFLQSNRSLRTVLSRWMGLNPASTHPHTPAEEVGLNGIQNDTLFDESVEIMVMGRSEGLGEV